MDWREVKTERKESEGDEGRRGAGLRTRITKNVKTDREAREKKREGGKEGEGERVQRMREGGREGQREARKQGEPNGSQEATSIPLSDPFMPSFSACIRLCVRVDGSKMCKNKQSELGGKDRGGWVHSV